MRRRLQPVDFSFLSGVQGRQKKSCHSKQSEESLFDFMHAEAKKPGEILRFAQNDKLFVFSHPVRAFATRVK
jgi:hypothetical protein